MKTPNTLPTDIYKVRTKPKDDGTCGVEVVNIKTGEVLLTGFPYNEAKRIATEMNTDLQANYI